MRKALERQRSSRRGPRGDTGGGLPVPQRGLRQLLAKPGQPGKEGAVITARHRPSFQPDARIMHSLRRPSVELEVIIPALNEERRLPATISTVVNYLTSRPWSWAIVVVDNDSVDRTLEITEQFQSAAGKIYAIGCSEHGKGAAVRRGILTSSARYIGFIDADNSTPIATVDEAMALLHRGYDAVIASRRVFGARYAVEQSLARRGGGWVFRKLAYLALPEIADTQCGFKFFAGPLATKIAGTCRIDGYAFDVELLTHIARAGRAWAEVPVVWANAPGSTFSIRRDGFRSVLDLFRINFARAS